MLTLRDPVKLEIGSQVNPLQLEQLRAALTYTDSKVTYDLQRVKRNARYLFQSEEDYKAEVERLKSIQKVSLLYGEGSYWTWSGVATQVDRILGNPGIQKEFTYPDPKPLPWDRDPGKVPYPYQNKAMEVLLERKHAGVQMGTGLGKSYIIALLLKRLGLKTLVMAPSSSIADQLYKEFVKLFGVKYVGAYYERKKQPDKLIVVGNSQSLTRVEEGSSAWESLSQTRVFVADESHQCPAKTLQKVCFGVVSQAPYRFFFSATQLRNDGAGVLLDAITGPIVYEMTVREGVDGGYLAKPKFHMVQVPSHGTYRSEDSMRMTRHHLFYNPEVVKKVGELCNMAVKAKMPVLVLIEEVEQFTKLLPYLNAKVEFAHGPLNENKGKVPQEYRESDPNAQVERFNKLEVPILVGTSCISTGTDVQAPQMLIYWQGGKSEIQVRQAVGRGTRRFPGKNCCHVVDFWVLSPSGHKTKVVLGTDEDGEDIVGSWTIGRHAEERMAIYNDLYGPVTEQVVR